MSHCVIQTPSVYLCVLLVIMAELGFKIDTSKPQLMTGNRLPGPSICVPSWFGRQPYLLYHRTTIVQYIVLRKFSIVVFIGLLRSPTDPAKIGRSAHSRCFTQPLCSTVSWSSHRQSGRASTPVYTCQFGLCLTSRSVPLVESSIYAVHCWSDVQQPGFQHQQDAVWPIAVGPR
jgi:hypothetical protein